jgi:putative membrane protein
MEYLWLKALHIISVISWMAGMLYLPRLYVYHAQQKIGSDASEMLKVMERKLLRFIINPAMIASWIFGIWLIVITGSGGPGTGGWMHVKLALLVGMQLCHAYLARTRRMFAKDQNTKSHVFYRYINEIPTVLMIAIVLLVVLKPF